LTEKAIETRSFEYPMPRDGINLHSSLQEITPTECLISRNIYWKGGMLKRGGQTLDTTNTSEVVASKRIFGLHRFYYGTSKVTVAAAGTVVKHDDGANAWVNVHTGLTEGLQVYFTEWQGLLYTANGTDSDANNHINSWDGTSGGGTAAVGSSSSTSGAVTQYLPYQDVLLAIVNTSTAGTLEWSHSFDDTDWYQVGTTNVAPDTHLYGMINHSVSNVDSGYEAGVLLAGADSMYLFKGTTLYGTTDYKIYTLSIPVGCSAPRTMCWTPYGSMWLGIDRQVYLLPFDSTIPVPVGHKIRSSSTIQKGIESLPQAQITNACAIYHDGFYKLSVASSGSSVNDTQWWLEVSRASQNEAKLWGPWFGPMEGQTISCFANTNGPGDQGDLLGGEYGDGTTTKGYVYELHNRDNMADITLSDKTDKPVATKLRTFYNPLGSYEFNKVISKIEIEVINITTTINLDLHDIYGAIVAGQVITITASGNLWDGSILWDGTETWGGTVPIRRRLDLSTDKIARRLSILLTTSSTTADFQLYALRVEAKELRISYD
jgi:hypothetical protein